MGNAASKLYLDHLTYAQRRHSPRLARWGVRNFLGTICCAMLFTVLLAAGAGECGQRIVDVDQSRRAAQGEHVLQELLQAVSAYPFEKIATLDDSADFGAGVASDSGFAVDLGVTNVSRGLLRIEAVLLDSSTQREIGHFVTYRRRS